MSRAARTAAALAVVKAANTVVQWEPLEVASMVESLAVGMAAKKEAW